jgi:hypothetical protein
VQQPEGWRLDATGLLLAGLVNTILAPIDYLLLLKPGAPGSGRSLGERAHWIAAHDARWQWGWSFWFVVTTTFAWSYFALGRHLRQQPAWPALAVGLALVAAAIDLVGVVANIAVLPALADHGATDAFRATQLLAHALTDVAAFGLYTAAGLLLLPALRSTPGVPRALIWLSVAEWGVSAVATGLLAFGASGGRTVAGLGFALYAPWVWVGAWWVVRGGRRVSDAGGDEVG